ncbi:MFS transporter [Lentiprolixibacter aurantiacus]|uniref:MFS transporter n=1 Tax=Lentiprolixibacter aurantiacus TaxID=2993939 RepID=A0AAE3MJY5_9FLAO|nr:MFS transporter [Lentiprolixibacter aurantiacus]MCX2718598.1 MFS transporter [Lentiprolixibacter aurantiacus]
MAIPKRILPVIVLSQFCCTSLWFAGNGVMPDLVETFSLNQSALGDLTSAVQFGFISGTLVFAFLTVADRFSPSRVFLISAVLGALFNAGVGWGGNSYFSLFLLRFFTGFFLAGIYPVGMKIASDYYHKGLGKSLGYLVGALVLGTAFPHLLKNFGQNLPWKQVIYTTSALALMGGTLMFLLVPDGPQRKKSQQLDLSAFFKVFSGQEFRSAAFGYFGHMWELYAFWAFVPVILETYASLNADTVLNIPLLSFLIIGVGGVACVLGGYLSLKWGAKKIAFIALLSSCICCILSPISFLVQYEIFFLGFLLFWGMAVIIDSPLFSTLVAKNALATNRGTALTIVNCIGFAITIISIQLLTLLQEFLPGIYLYLPLALGPVMGLIALSGNKARAFK